MPAITTVIFNDPLKLKFLTFKRIIKKTFKIVGWIFASLLFLILLIYILIQVPAVQNFARGKVVVFLQNKLHTTVRISKLSLVFPKRLVLEGVYFEDQQKDTLLYGGKLQVDIALLKLINGKVEINYIELKDINAKIYRKGADTIYNYQYIIDAFASSDTTTNSDTSGGMAISVNKIVLNNVGAAFRDDQSGIDFKVRLGKFETGFKKFDLDKMNFSLPDITLENVTGYMYQNKPLMQVQPAALVEAESNQPFNLQLGLKNITVKNINFDYRNDVSPMRAQLKLGELSGKVKSIDLAKLDIQLEEVKLLNTTADIGLGKSAQTQLVKEEINKEAAAQANNPWKITIAKVDVQNNQLAFEDDNKPRMPNGMDYAHLKISNFTLQANDLVVTPSSYAGIITAGSFKEQSGFNLQKFTTSFAYNDSGAALKNLYVQTPNTIIRNQVSVTYPSLDAVTKNMGKLYLNANLANTAIGAKDILIFAPQLRTNLKGNENAVVRINGSVSGFVNDLNIPLLEVSGIGSTVISLSGNIKGLPDANNTAYNLNLQNFQTTRTDLIKFLPPNTIPPNVRVPENIKLSGSFKGLATNFTTNLSLQTNKGNASIAGFVNTNNESYNIKGSLNNVDVGYLIKQDTMVGRVTMNFAAKGVGFKPATLTTNASAYVKQAFIKGYNYQNLTMTARMRRGKAGIDAGMGDKSIAFTMHGEALIDDKYATNIKLRLLLDSILMQPLGFTATDMRLHGNVVADMPSIDMAAPQGSIQLNDLVVSNDGQRYQADSINITAAVTDTGKIITLTSQIATAALTGQYNLTTMATGATMLINRYYNLGLKDSAIANDKWVLNATIIPDSMLYTFVPALAGTDTMKLYADFDGAAEKMNLLVNAPKIQMGTQVLDSLTITAGNDDTRFNFAATVNKAGSKSFQLQKTALTGYVADDKLITTLNIKDADGKEKYGLSLNVAQVNNGIRASLSDSLLLDYNAWAVDTSNYILYDSTGIIVHNFRISNAGESLSINSQTEATNAPIAVNLTNFHIKTLTNLAEQDSLQIDGTVNGNVLVKNLNATPVFTSDITIANLAYSKDTVGNIVVKVDNETANAFNANVAISGYGNDVVLSGKYFTGESKMDLKLDVNNLNLSSIRPFTFGALTFADGAIKGDVVMKGTLEKPDVVGELKFENANIIPAATGEKLHLSNEAIAVNSNDITFKKFTLIDSAGNKAVIDGKIFSEDFKTFRFGMKLNAKDFRVLNAPKVQNALYYGRLNMDANISVDGTVTAPVVNADLSINKATDITFVLPTTSPEIESREGVVQFVDMYGGAADSIFKAVIDTLNRFPKFAGMDIAGTLTSDTAAQITLVIDERSGDALKIRGKADLSGGLDKSGKISLTGNYELQSGSYQLTMSILKRQFLIQPGSLITWTGDPTSATVNITAVYVANTQPVNLLQSELAQSAPSDINRFKEKVPFNVLLKMSGELLKPIISFDIELPIEQRSRWQSVATKLEQIRRDEAELNKQVFALLLLGRFVQENPLENSGGGGGLESTARSSVSRLLTEQLNNLAGSLIKGVDLNFGVSSEDDYSTGARTNRTDLTVGVSKRLLNDRLRVSVGSNFELEGPANSNQAASNIAGDVAIDYLMSKDGRYALRAYRRNRYEGVVEGQVIESGVAFIFTLDFNELSEIFKKKKSSQAAIKNGGEGGN